jgi:hypothetical protein
MRWWIWLLAAVGVIVAWLLALVVPSAARYWRIRRM